MKKYLALFIILILVSSGFGQGKIYIHKDYDNNTRKENTVVYGHLNKYSTYYSTTIPIDSMKLYNTGSDTTKDTTMVYEIWDNMGFVATVGADTNASGGVRSVNIQVFVYEGWAADSVTRSISTKIDSFNIDTTGTIEHEFTLSTQPHFFMEFVGLTGSDTVYVYDMKLIRRRFTANGSSIDHGRLQGLADNDHPQYLLESAAEDSFAAKPALVDDNTFTGTNTFNGEVTINDTIWIINPVDGDTGFAHVWNDTFRIETKSSLPIKIGNTSLIIGSTGDVEIDGDLTVTGGFILPTHAHAELFTTDSALTTVSTGGTYYHLANNFDVTLVNRFSLLTDSLKYIGSDSVLIKWDFDLSASSDTPIEHGIWQVYVNSTGLGNSGIIHRDFKTANTEGSLGCNGLVLLGTNDVIYFQMTSAKNGTLWKHESIHFTVFEIERIPVN